MSRDQTFWGAAPSALVGLSRECSFGRHSMSTNTSRPDTVVLINGLWMTSLSWEHWVDRYTSRRGLNVIARSWPGMEGDIEAVRSDTSAFDHLGLTEITDYADIIQGLDKPPIIMGHSFGGLITQLLLDRNLRIDPGVAIDSSPVKGVLALPASTLKSAFPVLKNPANNHRSVMLTPEEFHYAFTNTLTEEESLKVYERYAVPGPGRRPCSKAPWRTSTLTRRPRSTSTTPFRRS